MATAAQLAVLALLASVLAAAYLGRSAGEGGKGSAQAPSAATAAGGAWPCPSAAGGLPVGAVDVAEAAVAPSLHRPLLLRGLVGGDALRLWDTGGPPEAAIARSSSAAA